MPLYEYECPACGIFEEERSVVGRDSASCPECKQPARRLFSLPWIISDGMEWEDPKKRARQFRENKRVAQMIKSGEPITPFVNGKRPREFDVDFDRQLKS